jgi:hypothetical protein
MIRKYTVKKCIDLKCLKFVVIFNDQLGINFAGFVAAIAAMGRKSRPREVLPEHSRVNHTLSMNSCSSLCPQESRMTIRCCAARGRALHDDPSAIAGAPGQAVGAGKT